MYASQGAKGFPCILFPLHNPILKMMFLSLYFNGDTESQSYQQREAVQNMVSATQTASPLLAGDLRQVALPLCASVSSPMKWTHCCED